MRFHLQPDVDAVRGALDGEGLRSVTGNSPLASAWQIKELEVGVEGREFSTRPDLQRDNGSGDGLHAMCPWKKDKGWGGNGKEVARSPAGRGGCRPGWGTETATPDFDEKQFWLRGHHFALLF